MVSVKLFEHASHFIHVFPVLVCKSKSTQHGVTRSQSKCL